MREETFIVNTLLCLDEKCSDRSGPFSSSLSSVGGFRCFQAGSDLLPRSFRSHSICRLPWKSPWQAGMAGRLPLQNAGFKLRDGFILQRVLHFDRLAADFAIFDIGLMRFGDVQNHGDLLPAVWAGKVILHQNRFRIRRSRARTSSSSFEARTEIFFVMKYSI